MTTRLLVADRVRTAEGVAGDAVLIEDATVRSVGKAADLRGPGVEEIDLAGTTIVPGLRDAHLHPVTYAAALTGTPLSDARSFAEVAERLREADRALPGGEPLVAMRLDDERLAEGRLPRASDLDAISERRPILVHRYCGHVAVANHAALALGGITAATPDPAGGVIDRDEDGEPTGVLRETAIELVSGVLERHVTVTPEAFVAAMRALAAVGLTSIGAMVGCGHGPWASLGDEIALLEATAADLPLRLELLLIADSAARVRQVRTRLDGASDRIRYLGLKQFADGSLGGHTAAMHEPYSDRRDRRGTYRYTLDDRSVAEEVAAEGGMVAIHAIGDAACTSIIDLFGEWIAAGVSAERLRLEHASILTPRDVQRLGDLGVHVSVQPSFLGSEREWLPRRLGADRMSRVYPLQSLLAAGARLAGGSDCPVEPPHPLRGMALARDRDGIPLDTERLDGTQALALYTAGAASALDEPRPLSAGGPADLVVLDGDPVERTPDELRTTKVLQTWVAGQQVDTSGATRIWVDQLSEKATAPVQQGGQR